MRSLAASAALAALLAAALPAPAAVPIQIGFVWHMHQPIYYPYESPVQTDAAGRFSYSVVDVHNQRFGPYTTWPRDAIQAGLALPHLGAQVSFSGSLIENLNALRSAGVNGGMWNGWDGGYDQAMSWSTSLGNRRLDNVAFGYHHPLLPLLDELDARMQIRLHKLIYGQTWAGGASYSRGLFPAETAFSERIVPWLAAEGIDWVIVDNIHFDRACAGYPHTSASGLFAPNPADQVNPDPTASGGAWVQLNNLWAPSKVSAPFGYRPHYVQYINPATGGVTPMIVVPGARYEGNEDARGGYGAFLYDQVMDQYIQYNTDPARPMLVLLHHDGDNYGGGSDSYYHNNFQAMVNWVSGDPDYDVTTVEDYLERFPVPAGDVIHVEPGSWAGADNGDPEFKKWLADPDAGGWSPDQNSWAVLTAAKNRVFMAEAIAPAASLQNVLTGAGSNTEKAWHWLLCGEASDYWYWDGTEIWDSNVTRAANQAVVYADAVLAGHPDATPPTVFVPQRNPYNPGGYEWGATPEPSDFSVWTFAYDVSGLTSVALKWRVDHDGVNPIPSIQNETYAGGAEVGPWNTAAMSGSDLPNPPGGVLNATYRAQRFTATIAGQHDVLIDYYVEAADTLGNVTRTDIQHVYVGTGQSGGGEAVTIDPDPGQAGQPVLIAYDPAGRPLDGASQVYAHIGFDNWTTVIAPDPSMTWDAVQSRWELTYMLPTDASQLDLAFNNGAGAWDNNNGADWHFTIVGGAGPGWQMDGVLDAVNCGGGASNAPVCLLDSNGGVSLWAGLVGDTLYVATNDAGEGADRFIYVALVPGALRAANWAKAGQIADWAAYLADENDNDYESWFDAAGETEAATGANGGVLEGTIDLRAEFGSLPAEIYLAVGSYATPDGGTLQWQLQVPASLNQNGHLDASEFLRVELTSIDDGAACPADLDGDGAIGLGDLSILLVHFGVAGGADPSNGDLDLDGDVDLVDLSAMLVAFGSACE